MKLLVHNCLGCAFTSECYLFDKLHVLENMRLKCPCWECLVKPMCNDHETIVACPDRRKLIDNVMIVRVK